MERLYSDKRKDALTLTEKQLKILDEIYKFVFEETTETIFILNGSAGTGKTTMAKEIIAHLSKKNHDYVLLAPTGRAAKVLSNRTQKSVKTLHSYLYNIDEIEINDIIRFEFVPRINDLSKPCVFIIDEASMISDTPSNDDRFVSKNSVLCDLINFASRSPENSKILFIGDHYQLPPVNELFSVALSQTELKTRYNLASKSHFLTEVIRHHKDSYILSNAMLLRKAISCNHWQYSPSFSYKNTFKRELSVKEFCNKFDKHDSLKAIYIGWKNSTVHNLNQSIRYQLHHRNDMYPLIGDQIILGQSYYKECYIPTGEFGKIVSFDSDSFEKIAETRFADAEIEFETLDGRMVRLTTKIDVDYLVADKAQNDLNNWKKLWADRKRKNDKFRKSNDPNDDPYLSAMKIKYGYAITTHKAQGGEWENVFLYPESPFDRSRLRWLYTANTRAKENLFSFSIDPNLSST